MAKLVNSGRLLISVWLCSAFWQLTLQAQLPAAPSASSSYYTAGVVEFRQAGPSFSSAEALRDNLQGYLHIITSQEAALTDIIVFPESTLNGKSQLTYVPDPNQALVAPCDEYNSYHDFLVQLSCHARNVSKYISVNIVEKENCSSVPQDTRPCAADGLNVYNTNVVFDRQGAVVSRYRKVHLYGEAKNTTYMPELGIFDTDFGVRFGHFICFDILFYAPTQVLVEKHGIRDFLFSSMWFSQLPFLTAVQVQASWAFANDVNLLAAGASYPIVGSTGSGIYAGRRGSLVAVMNGGTGKRALYVAQVPKYSTARKLSKRDVTAVQETVQGRSYIDIRLKRDNLEYYNSVALDLSQGNRLKRSLCFNKTFCCRYELSWRHLNAPENSTYYTYRLGVYNGWRKEESAEVNKIKNCAIFACTGDDIKDCGRMYAWRTANIAPQVAFERVLIEAEFPRTHEFLLMPNSLMADLMPVDVANFEWNVTQTDSLQKVRFLLNTTTDNLLTFAIYGNYFNGSDAKWENRGGGSDTASISAILLALIMAVILSS